MTTLPMQIDAQRVAQTLVEARVAACVQVCAPMVSTYRWEGAVHHDEERLLLIKTTRDRVASLWATLRAIHPYEVPEFLVLSAEGGGPAYLEWVATSTRSPAETPADGP